MFLGVVEELTALYIGPTYTDVVSFGILVLVLIVRLTGLTRKQKERVKTNAKRLKISLERRWYVEKIVIDNDTTNVLPYGSECWCNSASTL